MKRNLSICLAIGITALPLADSSAQTYTQPPVESVLSTAGFYQTKYFGGLEYLEPVGDDPGTVTQTTQNTGCPTVLKINPRGFGAFTYNPKIAEPLDIANDVMAYPYQSPYEKLCYATWGRWIQRPDSFPSGSQPWVYGVFAAGAGDLTMPGSGGVTYCGFHDVWYVTSNGEVESISGFSGKVKIQVTFNHSVGWPLPGTVGPEITTFTLTSVGAFNNAAVQIGSGGESNFDFPTVGGSNGLLTKKATAKVHFYGPEAIQIVGTFSGDWYGTTITGAFGANKVPPGQPGC
jgi:hypothetical protein